MATVNDTLTVGPALGRQHFASTIDVLRTVEALGGMNAQTGRGPGVGLYSRIRDFEHHDLDELLHRHELVKANLMRGTVHLVTARQYLMWRSALQPALERTLKQFCPRLWDGVDHDALLRAASEVLQDAPSEGLTRGQIDEALRPRFPMAEPGQLGFAARLLAPVVQVPDRSAWRPARTRYVLAESVLDGQLADPEHGLSDLLSSYLRNHGPASAADATYYTGITGLAPALRAVATAISGPTRTPLHDVADPIDNHFPATIVLPEYDSVWFGHRDGHCKAARKRLIPNTAVDMHGSVLVNGELVAAWKPAKDTVSLLEVDLPADAMETFEAFQAWYEHTSEETNR